MKDNGKMVCDMGKEYVNCLMVLNMKVIGKKESQVDMEEKCIQMEIRMKETCLMIKHMVTAFIGLILE